MDLGSEMKEEESQALSGVEREENWMVVHSRNQMSWGCLQAIWEKVWERARDKVAYKRLVELMWRETLRARENPHQIRHYRATSNGYRPREGFLKGDVWWPGQSFSSSARRNK